MYSVADDWVGQGAQRVFATAAGGTVKVYGNAGDVQITVSGDVQGDNFSLEFAAPPWKTLHPGLYTNAQRAYFRTAGHPGIDIGGDGRGCSNDAGRFDVKSIKVSGNRIVSLWLTYEQHCEGEPPALFGEVRINAARQATLQPAVKAVWWPDTLVGPGGPTVPAMFVATGRKPVRIAGARVVGHDPGDFPILEDDCTGAKLQPGQTCQVWVRFVPAMNGPRTAELRVTTNSGLRRVAALDGVGLGGRTELAMTSDPGDYIGQGASYDFTTMNATISASGDYSHVSGSVTGPDDLWSLEFSAPQDGSLTIGSTYDATRWTGGQHGGAVMQVFGDVRGCSALDGTFTVDALSVAPDGSLENAVISFVQHCEGATPALRGTFYWRGPTGDNAPPDPVSGLYAKRRSDGAAVVSWTNPSTDWSHTIVRYLSAARVPGSPDGSLLAYAGTRSTVVIPPAKKGPVSVAVYALDASGNVSAVRSAVLPAERRPTRRAR
jgi:hypothetical protein